MKDESSFAFTIGRSKASAASRTVLTRSKTKDHNNLVSSANIGDVDLESTMNEFIEQMKTKKTSLEQHMTVRKTALEGQMMARQTALVEQITNLSIII